MTDERLPPGAEWVAEMSKRGELWREITEAQIRSQACIILMDLGIEMRAGELPETMIADVAKRLREILRWQRGE